MAMQKIFVSIREYFFDMIFPIRCLGCGKNRENLPARERWICPDCLSKINLHREQVCPFCEKESEGGKTHYACRGKIFLDGLWVATYYDKFIEKAVHDFKFNFIKDLAHPLSGLMVESILEAEEFGDCQDIMLVNFSKDEENGIYLDETRNKKIETVLVPVPLHRRRYNWRGFNQSALLSKNLAEKLGLFVDESVFSRIKNTKPQSKTGGEEARRKNIDGAFSCVKPEAVKNRNIVLVDDLCTTSATLNECAKELKKSGAKNVWGLVVARR
ncbi:MAG: ComF family protein [Candidatus Paceibacterota bacterium]